jgi:hypothetical protein
MDEIKNLIHEVSQQFILCEKGVANHGIVRLTQFFIQYEHLVERSRCMDILEKIVAAQEGKNYLYVADLLQYELFPALFENSI